MISTNRRFRRSQPLPVLLGVLGGTVIGELLDHPLLGGAVGVAAGIVYLRLRRYRRTSARPDGPA
ncbi:hypothetical protein IQ251_04150 [Saccharopolyspora sp. HNM0983]|uniref:Uncharacterized protein n=1 Tax=Saccharopolyspora montiporae TaxID=2781240 RepID=A0A929B5M4_9PSEU|nr:hypothetical protein [Saccharopolyspora sp. HNM0983]MBE9373637.1 hypothetical protein [Saccharopolyspora sp. HNM0983]